MKQFLFIIFCLQNTLYAQPILEFAAQVKGNRYLIEASGSGVVTDENGYIYATGVFADTADFDPSVHTFNLVSGGWYGAYIWKLDPTGNLVWAKRIEGPGISFSCTVALDNENNILIGGSFGPTCDFDPGPGIFNMTSSNEDAFILKLDSSGTFIWAKQFSGTVHRGVYTLKTDGNGNIYAGINFRGNFDSDPGPGIDMINSSGDLDLAICKLDPSGTFVWSKHLGGTGFDRLGGVSIDAQKNVYVTGIFETSVDFDPGPSTAFLNSSGSWDIFILKLDSLGDFTWVKKMSGTDTDMAMSLTTDNTGNIYIAGGFQGICDFDPGPGVFNLIPTGGWNTFVAKLTPLGNFVWAKHFKGYGYATSIIMEGENLCFTGSMEDSLDFDPGPDEFIIHSNTYYYNTYICRLNNAGSLLDAWIIDGRGSESIGTCLAYHDGSVILTGTIRGTCDFDPSNQIDTLSAPVAKDPFVTKYSLLSKPQQEMQELIIPNVFTPNNDGINDLFALKPEQNNFLLECKIYNRWGLLVKSLNKQNTVWDGKDAHGVECTNGVYYYNLSYDLHGKNINQNGFVQLLR